jgi:hypothetical protein
VVVLSDGNDVPRRLCKATITLWVTWMARRKAIHEEIYLSTLSIFSFSIVF